MDKKQKIFISLLFTITFFSNLVSASYYGGFGYYSIFSFINTANPLELLAFGSIFLILFALIRLGLARSIFKDPLTEGASPTGNIVAAAIAFLIMYYGLYRSNFNLTLTPFFYNIGIPQEILYPLFAVIIIAGTIYFGKKMGMGGVLILGGLIIGIITYFTDWIYEKNTALVIAAFMILVGIGLLKYVRRNLWTH